jgi:hypothetical protein
LAALVVLEERGYLRLFRCELCEERGTGLRDAASLKIQRKKIELAKQKRTYAGVVFVYEHKEEARAPRRSTWYRT